MAKDNTPTTLREILDKYLDNQWNGNMQEAIQKQLKALLPEKTENWLECTECKEATTRVLAEDRSFNTGKCAHCNGELRISKSGADYGFNQAIQEIEKAIEEWAK